MSDNQVRGVILAGGSGTRLFPLTKVTNKHLLPVGQKPMIFHPIEKLVEAGIKDIMIITGTNHMGDVVSLLGSGQEYNCNFTYRVQDQAGGIAQALDLAKDFCMGHKFVVVLGDNIFEESLIPFVDAFKLQNRGARLLLKDVHDPERYGVATLEGKKIVKIVEKPSKPESSWAVTGIYMLDSLAFEFIKNCKPSGRGELEISDVNDAYVKAGLCEYDTFEGWWTDAGTHESLKVANELVS
jgi:glucose-1-phosphate thymidylyltransferase